MGDKMNTDNSILEKIICLLNKVNQTNKIPRDYGTNVLLYQSEIHTIEAIHNHGNISASTLSNILGITNGAITQIITKLKQKNLVEQYTTATNKKTVYYRLTNKGLIANNGHEIYHKKSYENLFNYLKTLDNEKLNAIDIFLDEMIRNWPSA